MRGKQVVYVPKRTDPGSLRGAFAIPVEEFAKAVFAFRDNPTPFSSRTSFLFDDSEDGGYRTVFGNGKEVWTTMPDEEFRLKAAIWWLSVAFGSELKKDRRTTTDNLEKAALERKWMFLFVARLVLQRSYGDDSYESELRRLFKGDWEYGVGGPGRLVEDLYTISKETLVYKYKEAAEKPGFVHRNWMRDPNTVTGLATYVRTAPIRKVRREKVDR